MKNLPAPVELQPVQSKPAEKSGGLLDGLFPSSREPKVTSASSAISIDSSTVNSGEPLSPESERLLHAVPDAIGGEADDAGGPADVPQGEGDAIAALMAQVAFEPQDVQDVICELFDWLAERFQSDHWQLTDRQARMLGRPAAQLANSMWAKLQVYIPDILGKWCEETPGATAFILACGLVIGPKVTKQVAISRERARVQPILKPAPQPGPQAVERKPEPARTGVIWSEGEKP